MSIYQPKRSRLPAIGGAIGMLVLGLALGWLLWGARAPDPIAAMAPTRESLADAADAIDVVIAHAEFAQEAGDTAPDYPGSAANIQQARTAYALAAPVVVALSPETATSVETRFDQAAAAIDAHAPPDEVLEITSALAQELRSALGGTTS